MPLPGMRRSVRVQGSLKGWDSFREHQLENGANRGYRNSSSRRSASAPASNKPQTRKARLRRHSVSCPTNSELVGHLHQTSRVPVDVAATQLVTVDGRIWTVLRPDASRPRSKSGPVSSLRHQLSRLHTSGSPTTPDDASSARCSPTGQLPVQPDGAGQPEAVRAPASSGKCIFFIDYMEHHRLLRQASLKRRAADLVRANAVPGTPEAEGAQESGAAAGSSMAPSGLGYGQASSCSMPLPCPAPQRTFVQALLSSIKAGGPEDTAAAVPRASTTAHGVGLQAPSGRACVIAPSISWPWLGRLGPGCSAEPDAGTVSSLSTDTAATSETMGSPRDEGGASPSEHCSKLRAIGASFGRVSSRGTGPCASPRPAQAPSRLATTTTFKSTAAFPAGFPGAFPAAMDYSAGEAEQVGGVGKRNRARLSTH